MKPEDAYAAAGYRAHRQNAHRLMTDDDVRDRIAELRAPMIESVQWDYRSRLELLRVTALAALRDGDHRAVIAAIAESNRMEGAYNPSPKEPQKSDASSAYLANMLREIIATRPALPVGPAQRVAASTQSRWLGPIPNDGAEKDR